MEWKSVCAEFQPNDGRRGALLHDSDRAIGPCIVLAYQQRPVDVAYGGDVYNTNDVDLKARSHHCDINEVSCQFSPLGSVPVSYTHLTLPTNREV